MKISLFFFVQCHIWINLLVLNTFVLALCAVLAKSIIGYKLLCNKTLTDQVKLVVNNCAFCSAFYLNVPSASISASDARLKWKSVFCSSFSAGQWERIIRVESIALELKQECSVEIHSLH